MTGRDRAAEGPDEPNPIVRKFQKELNSGTAALVLLALLERAGVPLYGYQIGKRLEEAAPLEGPLVKQGTLYPVLRSLESGGLLASETEPSVAGPPRRYYRITPEGRRMVRRWLEIWKQTRDFVDRVAFGPRIEGLAAAAVDADRKGERP